MPKGTQMTRGSNQMDNKSLANYSRDAVDNFYRQGAITQAQYEGFMHAWSRSAPRFGSADYLAWVPEGHADAEDVAAEIIATF